MSDHPSTIEGALKWAKVASECFGDEPPDMNSIALQSLANGYRLLGDDNKRLRDALKVISEKGCIEIDGVYTDSPRRIALAALSHGDACAEEPAHE